MCCCNLDFRFLLFVNFVFVVVRFFAWSGFFRVQLKPSAADLPHPTLARTSLGPHHINSNNNNNNNRNSQPAQANHLHIYLNSLDSLASSQPVALTISLITLRVYQSASLNLPANRRWHLFLSHPTPVQSWQLLFRAKNQCQFNP